MKKLERIPNVVEVDVMGPHQLKLTFDDGLIRELDFSEEFRQPRGPVFEPLRDPSFFAQVSVDHELGTIVWPNGADMDPIVLHGDEEPANSPPPAELRSSQPQ